MTVERQMILEYFNGDELATDAWLAKYALKDKYENVLEATPDETIWRAAKEFARADGQYKKTSELDNITLNRLSHYGRNRNDLTDQSVYDILKGFRYIVLGGSVYSMIGNKHQVGSLSNCFVIGQPKDSSNGIMLKRTDQFNLMKRRGGVGKDLSLLRPKGAVVNNAARTSTGASSFMDVDSAITNEVAQNGRRGALMLTMDIRHPDILEFITKKQDLTKVTGANISVKLTDDFMKAVENDEDFILRYPVNSDIGEESGIYFQSTSYNTLIKINTPTGNQVYFKKVKAKEVWDTLVHCAWNTAEPGIMFEDTHHNYSPDGVYPEYKGVTTNPCGEIFMQPYDSCRLLHHNLTAYVQDPFTDNAQFDYLLFYKHAYEALVLGDNLVDLELEAISNIIHHIQESQDEDSIVELELWKKIANQTKNGRRVGIGITGLADALAMMGKSLNSPEALQLIESIMNQKLFAELDATIDLAILRGTFEGWKNTEFGLGNDYGDFIYSNNFYKFLESEYPDQSRRMCQYGRRNISWSTVAPVGTGSLMTRTSSGIEPVFMPYYMRRKKCMSDKDRVDFTDELGINYSEYPVIHPVFEDWCKNQVITTHTSGEINGENTIEKRRADLSKKADLDLLFASSPWFDSTAPSIDWKKRVEIQSIVQKYTTHSISSTVNLPKDTPESLISEIYFESWKAGLKGITVYRDGCRDGILVNTSTKVEDGRIAPARPKELEGVSHKTVIKGVPHTVVIGLLDNKPYEIFIFNGSHTEGQGVVIKKKKGEYIFKSGDEIVPISELMNEEQATITRLTSMAFRHGATAKFVVDQLKKNESVINSFTSGMARVLSKYTEKEVGLKCSKCGGRVIKENGCEKCLDCGDSKCFLILKGW